MKVLAFLVLIVAMAGAVVLWQAFRFLRTPAGTSSEVVVFNLERGQSSREVAGRLAADGLITDADKFRIYSRIKGQAANLRVGEYALRRNMTPSEILRTLVSGRSIEYVVTVSEGLNRFEIAAIVEKAGIGKADEFMRLTADVEFVRATLGDLWSPDVANLEGYLFPETYHVTRSLGVRGLIRQMVAKFKEQLARVQYGSPIAVPLTRHQLVTLASIVEKETGAPEERPLISSVFHNRMKKRMRLQTDPTVIYGVWVRDGVWNGNISRKDLTTPTPYNTYVIPSLPPGPIANPGFHALQAAARPEESPFLFFVSRNDGTHIFSETYQKHRSAVDEYQLNRKAREGKSWRDLNKRRAQ
jgi:UPF0755 protein